MLFCLPPPPRLTRETWKLTWDRTACLRSDSQVIESVWECYYCVVPVSILIPVLLGCDRPCPHAILLQDQMVREGGIVLEQRQSWS